MELPAGLVDDGEDPAQGCRRELLEETGFPARVVHRLGETSPCTGRLSNRIYSFFVETAARAKSFEPEPGITLKLVKPAELARLIRDGEFELQLHIGALLLAELHGFLTLPRAAPRQRRRKTKARGKSRGHVPGSMRARPRASAALSRWCATRSVNVGNRRRNRPLPRDAPTPPPPARS